MCGVGFRVWGGVLGGLVGGGWGRVCGGGGGLCDGVFSRLLRGLCACAEGSWVGCVRAVQRTL